MQRRFSGKVFLCMMAAIWFTAHPQAGAFPRFNGWARMFEALVEVVNFFTLLQLVLVEEHGFSRASSSNKCLGFSPSRTIAGGSPSIYEISF